MLSYHVDILAIFMQFILKFFDSICDFFFQICGPLLDESQVRSIVDEIKQVITASSSRKRERAERAKAEDFDDEEGEILREENEQEEEVFDQVRLPLSIFIVMDHLLIFCFMAPFLLFCLTN